MILDGVFADNLTDSVRVISKDLGTNDRPLRDTILELCLSGDRSRNTDLGCSVTQVWLETTMNRTTKAKVIGQALQKYTAIHGVKCSGHVDHDKKDSLPVIDSSQKGVLHCQEGSFRAMRTAIGSLNCQENEMWALWALVNGYFKIPSFEVTTKRSGLEKNNQMFLNTIFYPWDVAFQFRIQQF